METKTGEKDQNQISKIMEKIKETPINLDNFEEAHKDVESMRRMAISHTQNANKEFSTNLEKWNNIKESDIFREAKDKRMFPITVFEVVYNLFRYAKEVAVWKSLQVDMLLTILEKEFNLLKEYKGSRIMAESLKRSEEWQEKNNKLLDETITKKLQFNEKTMLGLFEQLHGNALIQNRENTRLITNSVEELSKTFGQTVSFLADVIKTGIIDPHNDIDRKVDQEKQKTETFKKDFKEKIEKKEEEQKDSKLQVPELKENELLPKQETEVKVEGNDIKDGDEKFDF